MSRGIWQGLAARERALEVFGQLRVWDTEDNNGILVYVLFAERAVEILADRGIARCVPQQEWAALCREVEAEFAADGFRAGSLRAELAALPGPVLRPANPQAAQVAMRRALACKPDPVVSWNLGCLHLLQGEWARGWPLLEARWDGPSIRVIGSSPLAFADFGIEPPNTSVVKVDAIGAFIDGMESDLAGPAIATDEELDRYCYQVAGTVGRLMAAILGVRDGRAAQADEAARRLGMHRRTLARKLSKQQVR